MRPVKWQYFQWPWVFCWMYFTYCKSSGSIFHIVAYQLTRFGAWCVTWSLCITGVVVFFTLGYTETLLLVNLGVRSFLSRHILHSRLSDVASWLHISCWCVCVCVCTLSGADGGATWQASLCGGHCTERSTGGGRRRRLQDATQRPLMTGSVTMPALTRCCQLNITSC